MDIILYWKAIKVMIFYFFNTQHRRFIRLHKYYRKLNFTVIPPKLHWNRDGEQGYRCYNNLHVPILFYNNSFIISVINVWHNYCGVTSYRYHFVSKE